MFKNGNYMNVYLPNLWPDARGKLTFYSTVLTWQAEFRNVDVVLASFKSVPSGCLLSEPKPSRVNLKSLWQFGMHCWTRFSSCAVSKSKRILCLSKCERLDLSGLPVQCHTIPHLTSSPFPPPILWPPRMLKRKETIRPQSSADT